MLLSDNLWGIIVGADEESSALFLLNLLYGQFCVEMRGGND
jgi:hypothetical protein